MLSGLLVTACHGALGVKPDPEHPQATGLDRRRTFEYSSHVPAPPEAVFPLLCPTLEYLWLDDWDAKMIHSESGVAEAGAVFRTHIRTGETWVTTRYDPPAAVGYTVFAGPAVLMLDLRLEPDGDGATMLHWRRTYTPTSRLGNRVVQGMTNEQQVREMAHVHAQLVAYMNRSN